MPDLSDKTAIVTGAASGIGRATAELFVASGARVLMVDREGALLEAIVATLPKDVVSFQVADVSDPSDVKHYVSQCVDRFGGVDIAVFNAGVANRAVPLIELSVEEFDQVLAVNLRGPWLGLKHVIPIMAKANRGSVVMTSSVFGVRGSAFEAVYSASKHGLDGLMKSAALEYSGQGIRCNSVNPGPIDTPFIDSVLGELGEIDEGKAALAQQTSLKRVGSPAEVAKLIAFLASDDASYITGASYAVDGGYLAGNPW